MKASTGGGTYEKDCSRLGFVCRFLPLSGAKAQVVDKVNKILKISFLSSEEDVT